MKRIIRLTESDLTRIVRRVINERQYLMEDTSKDDASLNYICNAITNYVNQEIAKKRTTDTTFPDAKVEVVRTPTKSQGEDDITYSFKFNGVTIPIYNNTILSVRRMSTDTPTTIKEYSNALKYSFDNTPGSKYTPNLSKNLKKLPNLFGGVSKLVDTWAAQFQSKQPTQPSTGQSTTKKPVQPK